MSKEDADKEIAGTMRFRFKERVDKYTDKELADAWRAFCKQPDADVASEDAFLATLPQPH
jgi:hypothetical protein